MRKPRPIAERFAESYKLATSGCWLWIAGEHSGYGRMFRNGRTELAHRISYDLYRGPIPTGYLVCHTCDVPLCVNPDHLFLGTHKDNMGDRNRKNRTASGERNGNAKLTAEEVAAIRADSRTHREIARLYGIGLSTVSYVRTGRIWGRVD